ncbi:MAG: thioredoxin domain-containing protein, partial [Cyclobacteriaceae bacterium]|nr:thioredoxin domain-containing protein [Cyclobacteriaceae bacterium]
MKYITAVFVTILLYSCTSTTQYPMKNHLAQSTSPYLQQHVNNPVDWYPWGPEALERAKQEDKPILVSIGYSSCHWCHVMAHESFEDDSVADLMNRYFINIKVDREERPDVDQVYMDAIHAMGLQGGWPLNVFLTPDQKPFYGGTYFPKEGWKKLLVSVANAFEQNRAKIEESSDLFARALSTSISEQYELTEPMPVTVDALLSGYNVLRPSFDPIWGGLQKAPKFPMPSIWNYLNNLYHATQNPEAKDHFLFTLDKIYQGGIYDHVGGGFSRYSVDAEWHVPHFEKMLYDNGQLLSVYAAGYKLSGMESYQHVLLQTIDWLKREMLDKEGGFYAALDADSEGVEGKFYTWSYDEILELTGKDADLIVACYDVSEKGNWEGTNVLRLQPDWEKVAAELGYDPRQAEEALQRFQESALRKRGLRVRPGRDDKKIAGWNGLALTGLLDAYQALQDSSILTLAKETYAFIGEKMISDGVLRHVDGQTIEGFADDYAAVIQSFITYYQTTFDEGALQAARNLTGRMLSHFYDPDEQLFYYSSAEAESLIARKKEFF